MTIPADEQTNADGTAAQALRRWPVARDWSSLINLSLTKPHPGA